MFSMVRCGLRIFCMVGLVVLLGLAVVGQFWAFEVDTPKVSLNEYSTGVAINYPGVNGWGAWHRLVTPWTVSDLLQRPQWITFNGFTQIFIPWWLLLATWGLLTALIWRLTRRRKVGQGFPVEPAKDPAKSE